MKEIVSPIPLVLLGPDKRARDESCPSRGDTCPICNGVWEVGAREQVKREDPVPFCVPYLLGFVTCAMWATLLHWIM